MSAVSVFDAKNQLSALLDRVVQGEEVTITRRGKVVAKLVPAFEDDVTVGLAERFEALRSEIAAHAGAFSADEIVVLKNEGRR